MFVLFFFLIYCALRLLFAAATHFSIGTANRLEFALRVATESTSRLCSQIFRRWLEHDRAIWNQNQKRAQNNQTVRMPQCVPCVWSGYACVCEDLLRRWKLDAVYSMRWQPVVSRMCGFLWEIAVILQFHRIVQINDAKRARGKDEKLLNTHHNTHTHTLKP